jgi:hypothetical protein
MNVSGRNVMKCAPIKDWVSLASKQRLNLSKVLLLQREIFILINMMACEKGFSVVVFVS